MIELMALLVIWGLTCACWWGRYVAPMEYVDRAHKAEQRIAELEAEISRRQANFDSLNKDYKTLARRLEKGVYYG